MKAMLNHTAVTDHNRSLLVADDSLLTSSDDNVTGSHVTYNVDCFNATDLDNILTVKLFEYQVRV